MNIEVLPVFFDLKLGLPADAHAARLTVPDFFFHVTAAYCILRHLGVASRKVGFSRSSGAEPLK